MIFRRVTSSVAGGDVQLHHCMPNVSVSSVRAMTMNFNFSLIRCRSHGENQSCAGISDVNNYHVMSLQQSWALSITGSSLWLKGHRARSVKFAQRTSSTLFPSPTSMRNCRSCVKISEFSDTFRRRLNKSSLVVSPSEDNRNAKTGQTSSASDRKIHKCLNIHAGSQNTGRYKSGRLSLAAITRCIHNSS